MKEHRVLLTKLPPNVRDGLARDCGDEMSLNDVIVSVLSSRYGLQFHSRMRPARRRSIDHRPLVTRIPDNVWKRLREDAKPNGTITAVTRSILNDHYS